MSNLADIELLGMSYRVAMEKSTDPRTQNGAVLVTTQGVISDANRFPNGVKDIAKRWVSPLKYKYVEHAERNVIYRAAARGIMTSNTTMYVPWFACADCARGIIQAGISRVVGHDAEFHSHPKWDEEIKLADEMLTEAGIKFERIKFKFSGIEILFDGQTVRP